MFNKDVNEMESAADEGVDGGVEEEIVINKREKAEVGDDLPPM